MIIVGDGKHDTIVIRPPLEHAPAVYINNDGGIGDNFLGLNLRTLIRFELIFIHVSVL